MQDPAMAALIKSVKKAVSVNGNIAWFVFQLPVHSYEKKTKKNKTVQSFRKVQKFNTFGDGPIINLDIYWTQF